MRAGAAPFFRVVARDGAVCELQFDTDGGPVTVLGEFHRDGRRLVVRGLHVGGLWAQALGRRRILGYLCRYLREHPDVETIRIHGAKRTTGANPGRIPAPV